MRGHVVVADGRRYASGLLKLRRCSAFAGGDSPKFWPASMTVRER